MNTRSVFDTSASPEDLKGISKRVASITISAIKQMPLLAAKVPGCVSLGQGIPSFPTPRFIRDAVIEALATEDDICRYSLQPGMLPLRSEIARYLSVAHGARALDPEREIFVSCGGMEALAAAVATVVDRDDEVLIPSPTYASHIEQILFAEGKPVFVPLDEQHGWRIDREAFRRAITPRTKAILICNPSNPTGAVFSASDIRALADLAIEHDLFLIADETYDFLTYDGVPFSSCSALPDIADRLIAVYSFSKMFCMTGWRVGYMAAPARIIAQTLKVHDAFAICAPTVSQYAALAALREFKGDGTGKADQAVAGVRDALESRRNLCMKRLAALSEFFQLTSPQGAYYLFPKFTLPDTPSSVSLALRLLYDAGVITVPGSAFGPTGEQHIRFSFGGTEAVINEAFDRIEQWTKLL